MCDLVIYLRKGLENKSRDHTDVQSLNLIAGLHFLFPLSLIFRKSDLGKINANFSEKIVTSSADLDNQECGLMVEES